MYKIKYPIYITIVSVIIFSFIFTSSNKEQEVQKVKANHKNDQVILNDKYFTKLEALQIKFENDKKIIIDDYNTLISESEHEKKQAISKLVDKYNKLDQNILDQHLSINGSNFERDKEMIINKFESRKYHLSRIRVLEIKKLSTHFSIDSEKYYSKYSHNIRDKQREHEGSNHYSIPQ